MPAHAHTAVPAARRKPLGADSPLYHWWITAALMLGFTTAGLSVTVVQLAFPHIMLSLRADLDDMQWVQTSSMIMQAVMMPSVGWLGSRLGNRRLYLLSLGTFVSGSILCGMAWDVYSLIAFRVVQAIGSGPLFPLTQSIMFQTFPEEKRGLAMGVNSLGFSFGPMVGPVIGGYLLEHANWRTVFYINVPVGILGLILAYLVLPYPQRRESRSLDVLGLLSMAMFLVTFLLAITQGRDEGWNSQYIVTLLAVAAVAGIGFVVTELRQTEPFVEFRLYKNFAFAMASLVVFLKNRVTTKLDDIKVMVLRNTTSEAMAKAKFLYNRNSTNGSVWRSSVTTKPTPATAAIASSVRMYREFQPSSRPCVMASKNVTINVAMENRPSTSRLR